MYSPELEEHGERYDIGTAKRREEAAEKRTGLFGTRGGQANIGVTTGWHVITPEPSLYGPKLDIQLRQTSIAVDLHDVRCSLT
jgi:hypothetical protein